VRGVIGELRQLHEQDMTIIDMEASIEHMSRGTLRDVDLLLIITEPYFRALQTAGRISPLAHELGIPKIAIVANKVRSERDERTIRDYADQLGLDVIGTVPWDSSVQEADFANQALFDHAFDAPATREIRRIFDTVARDAGIEEPVAPS
jgi:CO dehydrogenase maturation factor